MQKDNILRRVFRNLLESDRNLKFWKEFNSIFEQSFKSLFGKLISSSKHSFLIIFYIYIYASQVGNPLAFSFILINHIILFVAYTYSLQF